MRQKCILDRAILFCEAPRRGSALPTRKFELGIAICHKSNMLWGFDMLCHALGWTKLHQTYIRIRCALAKTLCNAKGMFLEGLIYHELQPLETIDEAVGFATSHWTGQGSMLSCNLPAHVAICCS